MWLLVEIARYSLLGFAAVVFLLQLAAREIGYAIGRRAARPEAPAEGVGVVVTSMLGLLAFVLGLTLAYANTRFQERRQSTLVEAQSIGTSWLRATAIGNPEGVEIARLLADYTRLRMAFVSLSADAAALEEIGKRSTAMQAEIWRHVAALAQERPDPVVTALMMSLNETFDDATAQRYAFESGPAPQLVMLLLGMAMASMGGLGYQFGLRGRSLRTMTVLLLAMWTAVLVVIIDLGAPRLGRIRIDPAPYRWTLESFGGTGAVLAPLAK
jgi:hypothetical protein